MGSGSWYERTGANAPLVYQLPKPTALLVSYVRMGYQRGSIRVTTE